MSTKPSTKNPRTRSDVRREFGHPWPWTVPELFCEHVLDADASQKAVARRMATDPDTLRKWRRRHGFDAEDGA